MIELNDAESQRSTDNISMILGGKTPPFRTESLERILGDQAEPYFRQVERTLKVNRISQGEKRKSSMSGSRDRGGAEATNQNNSMGSLQISLTLPGIAEAGVKRRNQLVNPQPRLSSADKKAVPSEPRIISKFG